MLAERSDRAVRTRRALLHSAARVFDQNGYTLTTIFDISAGAGVSPGALHFHFRNKQAVADAVEEACASLLRGAGRIAYDANPDALQALTDMSHAFARLLRWDVVVRAGFRLGTDSTRARRQALDQEWHSCVERLLAEAARNDELSPDVRLQEVTCAVVTATTGIGLQIADNAEPRAYHALTGFWNIFLPGLARPEVAKRMEPAGRSAVLADAVGISARARLHLQDDELSL
ncbi:TetR/AcrR family transcriptional regulator [Streptomyces cocklensis]|uniref:Transcriptional regulator, TetR family n=1 Tax=Actinacidiphila cocklensis TaxID=887465 RepID=A0A9W4DII2_9ACTN|nr:ScbR family autoregulator-binding transcription factor [Actinacidiphila cocklensis]MDD1058689.1 TetR/AcrR family transcriptional regulator [Actinacidiphila cocklensis]WSX75107.1 TetR/AcrR family transcriptional regulator [Streptomyces sp. NBC_00899]CAG6390877.1 Transcriptional regulator, TetR family [Actinacidiphila cocklensis]